MKKRLFVVFLLVLNVYALFSQEKQAISIDVVIMVDVSSSMEPYYNDVINTYVINIINNMVFPGDRLCFLSFSDSAHTVVNEIITDKESLKRIIERIRLLEPVDLYTDLVNALNFLNHAIEELDPTRPKLVLLFTDGVHDPQPGSPNAKPRAEVLEQLLSQAQTIKNKGWSIHVFALPQRDTPTNPRTGYLQDLSDALDTKIKPFNSDIEQSLQDIGQDVPPLRRTKLPDNTEQPTEPKNPPTHNTIPLSTLQPLLNFFTRNLLLWLVIAAILIGLVLWLKNFLFVSCGPAVAVKKGKHIYKSGHYQADLIEMLVYMQNTKIGFRNIKVIPPNGRKIIGGGRSSFLIFLFPLPYRVAEIHHENDTYTFVPIKKEFFPELSGKITDCLNREIPARSKKGYVLTIVFRHYVSALDWINNFLNSRRPD